MKRRSFLQLSAAVITAPDILMPVKEIIVPRGNTLAHPQWEEKVFYSAYKDATVVRSSIFIDGIEYHDSFEARGIATDAQLDQMRKTREILVAKLYRNHIA